MAIVAAPSLNLSYIGNGPTASGQIISDGTPGVRSKTLYAYGVAANGNTTTGANAAPVGFIDGTSTLPKVPTSVQVFVAGNSADTAAVLAAANPIWASTITNTGFILNWTALATTAQTFTFGAVIAFSS